MAAAPTLLDASVAGDVAAVRALLAKRDVDLEARDKDGLTALYTASRDGHVGVVELLLECGADTAVSNKHGWTPINAASDSGYVEIVRLLLKAGADPHVPNEQGWTPLNSASDSGYVEIVKMLLEAGADPNIPNEDAWTPLHAASDSGYVEIVRMLLEAGVDPRVSSKTGWTPLNAASDSGHVEVVKLLLGAGGDPNIASQDGWAPIHAASSKGRGEVVEILLKAGVNLQVVNNKGLTPLNAASDSRHHAIVKMLLEAGADPSVPDESKVTPLHNAARNGRVEMVKLLLKVGVDPNVVNKFGYTPLHSAAIHDRVEIVELLLNAGSDPDCTNKDEETPLFNASNLKTAKLLLSAGANPNATNKNGETPLIKACRGNEVAVVKQLLMAAANPNITSKDHTTPLYEASRYNNVEIVQLLVMAGADPDFTDQHGKTPLYRASESGYEKVVAVLLRVADPNISEENGETPLHAACRKGHVEVAELLLKGGANPSAPNTSESTPLHYACFWFRTEIARLLLSFGSDLHAKDDEDLEPLHECVKRRTYDKWGLDMIQVLVSFGATWDAKCDEIASREDRVNIDALRICMLTWAQEHADDLPLTQVDQDVLKRGPEQTQTLINELKNSTQIKYRRKICVVGPSKAGKTTLVKSLTSKQPSLVHPDDRTIGVDQILLRFGVEVPDEKYRIHEVTFWDFAGQDEYQVAHSLFFSARTLYLVCVDLEALLVAYMQADLMGHSKRQCEQLMNEFIERDILRWVRLIFSHQPDAEFAFVATKDDLLTEFPAFTKEVKAFLATKLEQVEGIVGEMKRELLEHVEDGERRADTLTIHAYEKRVEMRQGSDQEILSNDSSCKQEVDSELGVRDAGKSSTNLRAKFAWGRRAYQQLVSTVKSRMTKSSSVENAAKRQSRESTVVVKPESLYVSCSDVSSVERARSALIELIVRSDRSFLMPDRYTDMLTAVVAMREEAATSKSETRVVEMFAPVDALVESLVTKVNEMETKETTETKEKTGDSEKIDKRTCTMILQTLHDLGDVLWYENLGIELFHNTIILDPLLLIDFVRQVINHNNKAEKLAHGELKTLPFWASLTDDQSQCLALKQVLQKFQLVYPSDGDMKWNSDLIVPAFWKSKTPASWLFGYEDVRLDAALLSNDPNQPEEQVRVHWEYHFAHEFPDALFDHLVVDTHSPYLDRDAGPDWIMYANDGIFACRAMVARDGRTLNRVLQLEAVLAKSADEAQVEELWEAFECLSEGIVKVLRRYRGLVVTAVALDWQKRMNDIESLFRLPLKGSARKWMPRAESWDLYKRVVGYVDASSS